MFYKVKIEPILNYTDFTIRYGCLYRRSPVALSRVSKGLLLQNVAWLNCPLFF
jgi:hypothetical protein